MLLRLFALILLLAVVTLLLRCTIQSASGHQSFKQLDAIEDRQDDFRQPLVKSALFFSGGSLAALILLGRPGAILTLPDEFRPLIGLASAWFPPDREAWLDLAATFAGLVVATSVLSLFRRRLSIGDFTVLLPRNRAELRWTALVAINAGISEELFFRLLLPLLITLVTGDVRVGFAVSCLLFGLTHLYQRWQGVLLTTIAALALSGFYLATGQLWVVMLFHVLIDLNQLVLQPWLRMLVSGRQA